MVSFPMDFSFFGIVIPSHLVFEILAFLIGFQLYFYLREKRGDVISSEYRFALVMGAAVGALLGSRVLAALEHPSLFFSPPSFLYYYEGKTIVGGLLGGWMGVGERR